MRDFAQTHNRNGLLFAVEGIEGQTGFLNLSGGEFWEAVAAPAAEVPTAVRFGRLSCCSPESEPGEALPPTPPPHTHTYSPGPSRQDAEVLLQKWGRSLFSLPLFSGRRKMGRWISYSIGQIDHGM